MSNEKKSYICEKLGKTLNFLPDKINFCCSYATGANVKLKDGPFSLNKIIKAQKTHINELKKGIVPENCTGCIDYKEKEYKNILDYIFSKPEPFKVKEIIVNHFEDCDCKCLYCELSNRKHKNSYELLPIIKELYKNNIIDKKELRVEFQGGNVSVLQEFEALMNEFLENGCKRFSISTNAIEYLPIIEDATRQSVVDLQISLDSGTKETFAHIKQVDAFEKVVNNIKEFSIKTAAVINLKYVIVNGINDNGYEVGKFLELAKNLRCINCICFDIDYRDILYPKREKFQMPPHYYELVNQAKTFCEENRIDFVVASFAQQYMDNNKPLLL